MILIITKLFLVENEHILLSFAPFFLIISSSEKVSWQIIFLA